MRSRYSLEAYERYPTLAVRPGWNAAPPDNGGYGVTKDWPGDLPVVPLRDAKPSGSPFALLLEPDTDGLLDTAWMLAEKGLQRHWQAYPVYARLDGPPNAQIKAELRSWHVRAANFEAGLHADLRLRRLTCPQTLSAGGAMPLRLWLDNAGPSPLYGEHRIVLRFIGSQTCEVILSNNPGVFRKTGDIVYNEITQLPSMPEGTYSLHIGVRGPNGMFHLNVAGGERDGFHALCDVPVDSQPRPELFRAWDNYYPEGYYPLEDPKEPGPQ